MRIEKGIAAIQHLLLNYQNDRTHIHGEIASCMNVSDHCDFDTLVHRLDKLVERDVILEHKMAILTNFLVQIKTQQEKGQEAQSTPPQGE